MSGFVKVVVHHQLTIKGISFIAGGNVFHLPVVTDTPTVKGTDELVHEFPSVFKTCL